MLKFSLIIPTYNRPDRLSRCLDSIAKLDYPRDRFEVLVVNDGSSLPLEPVVNPFQERLSLRLVNQTNAGPGAARNRGASLAKGQYLAFTDDDCTLDPQWLTHLEQQFERSPDALLGGATVNVLTENLYSSASQILIDYLYHYYGKGDQQTCFFASNNIALNTDKFREIGGFDTHFTLAAGEDRDLCDRWSYNGYPLEYVPQAIVYHAHQLSLKTYWKQHFNYGRGAFCFHQARAHRKAEKIQIEPSQFYWQMFLFPAQQKRDRPYHLASLLFLSQFATAAGFFWEKYRPKSKPFSPPISAS